MRFTKFLKTIRPIHTNEKRVGIIAIGTPALLKDQSKDDDKFNGINHYEISFDVSAFSDYIGDFAMWFTIKEIDSFFEPND